MTVLIKHIEFGQGPFTGLATIVAEELDADWCQGARRACARRRQALRQPRVRRAGHRRLDRHRQLLRAAAQGRRDGARHAGAGRGASLERAGRRDHRRPRRDPARRSNRQGRFGQFAEAAAQLPVPENRAAEGPGQVPADRPEGAVKKLDSAAKSNGKAQFTIDIREPGMLTVVVARPPRFGGKVASFDAAEALPVPGRGRREAGALGRRGLCQRHVAGAEGPREAEGHLGRERRPRSAAARSSSRSFARLPGSRARLPARTAMPKPCSPAPIA